MSKHFAIFTIFALSIYTMSIHKFTAPLIYTAEGSFAQNTVIVTDENGTILSLDALANHDPSEVNKVEGAIIPGMINTHCHLELSHMKGLVDTGTSLLPFLKSVVQFRDFAPEIIALAIEQADQFMYDQGIVAVGDISNKTDTLQTKQKSKIRYCTFVEIFDFLHPGMTEGVINQYEAVYEAFAAVLTDKDRVSRVPHAPYTVSPKLFDHLRQSNPANSIISIHNQETPAENELFVSGTGAFRDFYSGFGIDLSSFQANGKTSIHYALEHMDANQTTIFVHNTTTTAEDIKAAHEWGSRVFWATCANANLYIENRLPHYQIFIDSGQKITIGTDSLTSNWQLSVWEEIRTIKRYNSWLPLEELVKWATANGAAALGMDDTLGQIKPGKKPGLVVVPIHLTDKGAQLSEGQVRRLI